jgi:hypothetical protein
MRVAVVVILVAVRLAAGGVQNADDKRKHYGGDHNIGRSNVHRAGLLEFQTNKDEGPG